MAPTARRSPERGLGPARRREGAVEWGVAPAMANSAAQRWWTRGICVLSGRKAQQQPARRLGVWSVVSR